MNIQRIVVVGWAVSDVGFLRQGSAKSYYLTKTAYLISSHCYRCLSSRRNSFTKLSRLRWIPDIVNVDLTTKGAFSELETEIGRFLHEIEIWIQVIYILPVSSSLGNRQFNYLYPPVIQPVGKPNPNPTPGCK